MYTSKHTGSTRFFFIIMYTCCASPQPEAYPYILRLAAAHQHKKYITDKNNDLRYIDVATNKYACMLTVIHMQKMLSMWILKKPNSIANSLQTECSSWTNIRKVCMTEDSNYRSFLSNLPSSIIAREASHGLLVYDPHIILKKMAPFECLLDQQMISCNINFTSKPYKILHVTNSAP